MDILALVARVQLVTFEETLGREAMTERDGPVVVVLIPRDLSSRQRLDVSARVCARLLPRMVANDHGAPVVSR